MDRELLLEIGCEELPASWLPGLTDQIGDIVIAELKARRLMPEAPAETYSTPRRLTVRIARLAERQTDLEELVTGPPVSAGFAADGTPTPAAVGFAAKQGVEVEALERVSTGKGTYLAYRKKQRGRAAVDVLPDVLGGTLRGFAFPKQMHWDAQLEDGKGELLFGRPIRWLLFLYGGRVVPYSIARTAVAQSSQVQEVNTGAFTYGHRFLTTSGRAGRAIKVRSFDEYRARLLENFVILEREGRHNKIARELDAKAQRLQGRVSHVVHTHSGLLNEVPDLVEYPSVVGGTFGVEFLSLPEEVLTTTLIHHQHYFPVESEDGRLKNAFLAVINTEPDNERTIARNAERVVTARLRDAKFFWDSDRKATLESRVGRLSTLLFHKKLGSYGDKLARIERLAGAIARDILGGDDATCRRAALAARLAKTDLTTDMVREFTELQGTMGGIYAREEGQPAEVWKAIYYHYLPVSVEADAEPAPASLGAAAPVWVAVSLADKLDTIVGLFGAGEKPTGSRDPYGLRRAAHGVLRILLDLRRFTGQAGIEPSLAELLTLAAAGYPERRDLAQWPKDERDELFRFLLDRLRHVLESRGADRRNVRAVTSGPVDAIRPAAAAAQVEALGAFASAPQFTQLATAFKRVKNIASELKGEPPVALDALGGVLSEPAEQALLAELQHRLPLVAQAAAQHNHRSALANLSELGPAVDKFFTDVLVMAEDPRLRTARLSLMAHLRDAVLRIGDVSEVVAAEK
ncbi:MAG: glycine--tRNA ligase subunit beta [Vicinamibacterales bacterium]